MSRRRGRGARNQNKRQWDSKPLFQDPNFPADSSVLYRGGQRFGVQWKRPWEISENPVFADKGTTYSDVDQGDLGNCWFLSSVCCLAVSPHKDLLSRVIPNGQGFGPEYTGKFVFKFWQYGKWDDVVIDDRLPTYDGKLIYSKNRDQPHEYWVPLLEKAFAKLYGNYNVLDGGRIHTALVDLTGGLGEMLPLKEQISDSDLTDLLLRCSKMNSFMGGSIFVKHTGDREVVQASGLIEGHAYTIVKVKEVNTTKGKFVLLHIRNPHGRGEWKGAWSDKSQEWNTLSDEDKQETHSTDNNGEFWISVSDFRKHFDELELCHLKPEGLSLGNTAGNLQAECEWKVIEHRGKWDRMTSSGGPPISFMSKLFWSNPQIELHIAPSSETTVVVISLYEVNDFLKRAEDDVSIGFSVFQMPKGTKVERLTEENYYEISPRMVQSSGVSWPYRERTHRFALESGEYIIVPYTSRAGQEADFYLRIFAESRGSSPVTTTEIRDTPAKPDPVTTSVTATLNKAFDSLAGTVGAIDAAELVQVLNAGIETAEGKSVNFSIETCRCLIAVATTQSSTGLIDQIGLHSVWKQLSTWREAFRVIDKDINKLIDAKELKNLFDIIELSTSPVMVEVLMKRYGGKIQKMSEDDFLQGVCKALLLRGKYLELKRNGRIVDIELSEWMTFGLGI